VSDRETTRRWRKKPVEVEAVQWHKPGDHPAVTCWHSSQGAPEMYRIQTLEGPMSVSPGDWIIRGVAGEFYSIKPSIFEATYEPVE
jgi:hypothetical protein